MRRRLLISTLLVAVTAVLLLGVPLAIVMTRLVRDEAVRQLQRDATTVATALRYRANHHQLADYREFRESLPGDYITIRQKDHPTEIIGKRPPRHQLITGLWKGKSFKGQRERGSMRTRREGQHKAKARTK